MLPAAIARATEIREHRDRPLLETLREQFADREILLLLDNFEQILPAATQLSDLLMACPGLRLLVTSRAALRSRWEQVIPVAPLAVPDLGALPRAGQLSAFAAVELFVRRAQGVEPSFVLDDSNAAAVAEICVRLDGLPLAIELAAARTRVLPPRALLSRLGRRLDVLAAPNVDQPLRQRTLRAALDWSYELLPPAEQAFFRRLGVFMGGFGLAAVDEVCDPDRQLGLDGLAAIQSLVDKSLLRREPVAGPDGEPRFGLLETVREYALERLEESGETEITRRRHAYYFLSGADVPVAEMKVTQQMVWLQSLEAEHDNLRTALAWCGETRTPELGLSAARLLAWFWIVRGHVSEGRRCLTSLLDLAGQAAPILRAEALRVIGSLALHQGDYALAARLFENSLALRRELGDPAGLLSSLSSLGAVFMQQGELERAETSFNEAMAIQKFLEDPVGIAESYNNLANIAHERGDLERARQLYEASLAVQQTGVRYRQDVVLHNLGVVAQEQGDLTAARQHFQDSVAMRRALGDTGGLALSLAKLGEVLASMGDARTAQHLLGESLTLERALGDRSGMAFVLERFATAAVAAGRARQALRFAAAAEGLREAIGVPLSPAARAKQEQWVAAVRAELAPEIGSAEWEQGRRMTLDEVAADASQFADPRRSTPQAGDTAGHLTTREREVAVLLAQGLSNRDIAERLVVSERTAENHVQRVLNRLGLRSRAHVAAWVVRNGLVEGD